MEHNNPQFWLLQMRKEKKIKW